MLIPTSQIKNLRHSFYTVDPWDPELAAGRVGVPLGYLLA